MKHRAKVSLCLMIGLNVLSSSVAASGAPSLDAMKHAEQLFNSSKYEDAAGWYKTQLSKEPQNSTAHYMLGVCLVKLNRSAEAIPEFNLAKKYDSSATIGGYADQYLRSLAPANAGAAKSAEVDLSKKTGTTNDDEKRSREATGNAKTAESIGKVSSSASAALEAECASEIERVDKDANQKIARLTEKMEKSLAEVPRSLYRNTGSYYQDLAIKAEYQQAVKSVRDEAERREAEIKAHYRMKQTAVEDAASAMHKSYESKNQVGKIILSPVGTNMNVRNYQTADEPTGNDVPVVAAPAKGLPLKKH